MGTTTKNKKIKPCTTIPYAESIYALAGGTITADDVLYVSAATNAHLTVARADADAAISTYSRLYVAKHDIPNGSYGVILPWKMLTGANTFGSVVGNPIYLSNTAGGWSLTAGTIPVIIGEVLVVSATVGIVLLDPQNVIGPMVIPAITLGDNLADALSISEGANPYLRFRTLNATERLEIPTEPMRFYDDISCQLGTDGDWDMSFVSAGPAVTFAGLDYTNAAGTASAAYVTTTGDSIVTGAAVGGNSGLISFTTGATDSTNAGGTAGDTGPITLQSGDSTSTLGGSGDTGDINLTTGDSTDLTSGDINLTTGTAGTVRGDIQMDAREVDIILDNCGLYVGATQRTDIRAELGATTIHFDGEDPAANTTSWHVIMESGAATSVANARTSGNLTLRSGTSNANGNNGGASGGWIAGSGDTDATSAHIAAASGLVLLQSGDCASTAGGGTSGTSGNVNVETGTSADANTGTITITSGVPAAAGTSGNVALATGATAGAGTSGNITATVGTTVASYTHGSATLTRQGLAGDLGAAVYHPATDSTAFSGDVVGFFDRSVTVPAYALKAGSVLRITWKATVTAVTTGGDTLTMVVGIGPNAGAAVAIATSGAVAVAANNIYCGTATVIVKATGAPGSFDAVGSHMLSAAPGGNMISFEVDAGAVDTTAANVVGLTADWSTPDTGNDAVLEMLVVELIVP